MSEMVTIHIPLLNEGTTVSRPTLGESLGDQRYCVRPTPNYDPADEEWEFLPGSIVVCEEVRDGGTSFLIARRLA